MRCKACNAVMLPGEIIWREMAHDYETLCADCRRAVYADETPDDEALDTIEIAGVEND
jgi:hypothetical protein